MKKRMTSLALVFVFLLSVMLMAGCGKMELDAEQVVNAYLKAELKGDVDEFAELVDADKKEVQEEYDTTISDMTEIFAGGEELDGELAEEFPKAIKELLASAKYEVKDSEKGEDGNYTVTVTIYPSDVFTVYVEKMMEAGASATEDTDLGSVLLQALKGSIDGQTFGEGEDHQIKITYDKDEKVYEIDEDDTTELMEALYVVE